MFVDGEGILGWFKNLFKPIDRAAELQAGLGLLYTVNYDSKFVVDTVKSEGKFVQFQAGDLPGATLATTEITSEGATITVDIFKVQRAHDHIVPVLAHEIQHVRQAFLIFGVEEFCAMVARDKHLIWHNRELEIHAVAYEDDLRARLIASPYWKARIARTRVEAQRLASRLGVGH